MVGQIPPLLPRRGPSFRTNSKGKRLDPTRLLRAPQRVDLSPMESLIDRSLVSVADLDAPTVTALIRAAALLESTDFSLRKPLDGKVVVTAFFEASTRTRLSFESAVLRLDGKILSVPDGRVTGIQKGESLADIGEMLNTYGDAVVMRHPKTESVVEVRRNLHLPLINAGNGSGEHPTQALLDMYALAKWRPALLDPSCPEEHRVHVGVLGTPGSMRAVHSFVRMLLFFPGAIRKLTVVSEMAEPFGDQLSAAIGASEIETQVTHDASAVLSDLDVIYINSIAFLGDQYRTLDESLHLSSRSPLKPTAVVMHPLARRHELAEDLDDTEHNLYFAQAAGAVFMRQAVLTAVLARTGALVDALNRP